MPLQDTDPTPSFGGFGLRMTRSGQLTLYAVQSDTGEVRSYDVDQVQSIRVSSASFTPRFAVEALGSGLTLRQVT